MIAPGVEGVLVHPSEVNRIRAVINCIFLAARLLLGGDLARLFSVSFASSVCLTSTVAGRSWDPVLRVMSLSVWRGRAVDQAQSLQGQAEPPWLSTLPAVGAALRPQAGPSVLTTFREQRSLHRQEPWFLAGPKICEADQLSGSARTGVPVRTRHLHP